MGFYNDESRLGKESWLSLIRSVFDACADCDTCRFLMDDSCLFFPELYRLYDREKEEGHPPTENELKQLSDMCTLCGLCPCPDIRTDIVRSKAARVRENGMPMGVRLLADVQGACRLGARFPGLINTILKIAPVAESAKRLAGIARERELPQLPNEDFFSWARRKGLNRIPSRRPKAAYFAGCTAAWLFPEVARSAVAVLERGGISVYVPPQQCCGMPTLLEGAEDITITRVRDNLKNLSSADEAGCDLVTSCPTCGFFMKTLLKEGACYSEAYQDSVSAGPDEIRIHGTDKGGHASLQKSIYGKILKDNPSFSAIDPLARIGLSEKLSDMGQYLEDLHRQGCLDTNMGEIERRVVYFAPCHQREQKIGSPYENLLALIPGLSIEKVGGVLDCCGMGGSLGFKSNFHDSSIRLGQRLVRKIEAVRPEAIVTDCLSCRLQFRHLLPALPIYHPLEIMEEAYFIKSSKEKNDD